MTIYKALNMVRAMIVIFVAMASATDAGAYVSQRDAAKFVNYADIVAVIYVVAVQPNFVYKDYDYACGYTVTARVRDSLKGASSDQRLVFGAADPLDLGQRYLVSLIRTSDDFAGAKTQMAPSMDMSGEEVDHLYESCHESVPFLKEQWEFRSEFITSTWIPLGYAVYLPPLSEVNSLGVRVSEVKFDYFREEGTETVVHRLEDDALPKTLSEILPFELKYPTAFVEWAPYRKYLEGLIESHNENK